MRNRILFSTAASKPAPSLNPCLPQRTNPTRLPSLSPISTPPVPLTQPQFNYQFSQFTTDLTIFSEIKQNLKYLYQLYKNVVIEGGLVDVLAYGKMESVMKNMGARFPQIMDLEPENILEHYIKFCLFSFEIVIKTSQKIQNNKLISLQLCKFIKKQQIRSFIDLDSEKGIKIYDNDIIILKDLCSIMGIETQAFKLEAIKTVCEGEAVRVRGIQALGTQVKDGSVNTNMGLNYFNRNIKQKGNLVEGGYPIFELQFQLPIKQFSSYFCSTQTTFSPQNPFPSNLQSFTSSFLSSFSPSLPSSSSQPPQSFLLSAQNFDPKNSHFPDILYKKLNNTFLCFKQNFDFCSYLDQDIPEITLPNFMFLVEGCWSGGKQQPYGIAKVDINFGPNETEWYCLGSQALAKFEKIFKEEFLCEIECINGKWFEDIDWFITRMIPIKKVVQQKGDAMILGSGSLSWFKSNGKSIHASWNIIPKTQKQIISITTKFTRLKQLSYTHCLTFLHSTIKIPIKTLFLRILNHQQLSVSPFLTASSLVILTDFLRKSYNDEQKYLNQMTIKQNLNEMTYKNYYLFDIQSFCKNCHEQILLYFCNWSGVLCLKCLNKNYEKRSKGAQRDKDRKGDQRIGEIYDKHLYAKYDNFWIYQLIFYGDKRKLQFQDKKEKKENFEFQEICKGEFIINNKNCSKIQQNSGINIIDQQSTWSKVLDQLYNLQYNTIENAHNAKIQNLIAKNMNKKELKQESLASNFMVQTDLTFSEQYSQQKHIKKMKQQIRNIKNQNETILQQFFESSSKYKRHYKGGLSFTKQSANLSQNSNNDQRHKLQKADDDRSRWRSQRRRQKRQSNQGSDFSYRKRHQKDNRVKQQIQRYNRVQKGKEKQSYY